MKYATKPVDGHVSSHRQFRLDEGVRAETIDLIVGEDCRIDDDPDRVENSWAFLAIDKDGNEYECAVWDYKGCRWSCFGPLHVFETLFPGKVR